MWDESEISLACLGGWCDRVGWLAASFCFVSPEIFCWAHAYLLNVAYVQKVIHFLSKNPDVWVSAFWGNGEIEVLINKRRGVRLHKSPLKASLETDENVNFCEEDPIAIFQYVALTVQGGYDENNTHSTFLRESATPCLKFPRSFLL